MNLGDDLEGNGEDLLTTLLTTGEDLLKPHDKIIDNNCDDNVL